MNEFETRLTDLEIRYTHQAELLSQLSDLVREQQRALDQLGRTVTQLGELLAGQGDEDFPHEKPPHY